MAPPRKIGKARSDGAPNRKKTPPGICVENGPSVVSISAISGTVTSVTVPLQDVSSTFFTAAKNDPGGVGIDLDVLCPPAGADLNPVRAGRVVDPILYQDSAAALDAIRGTLRVQAYLEPYLAAGGKHESSNEPHGNGCARGRPDAPHDCAGKICGGQPRETVPTLIAETPPPSVRSTKGYSEQASEEDTDPDHGLENDRRAAPKRCQRLHRNNQDDGYPQPAQEGKGSVRDQPRRERGEWRQAAKTGRFDHEL